ncbi:MAG: hypothetical protein K2J40_10845 [Ruminococcus sp.]|nr:hypothetical protein [Ruminococcus sp.]
MKIIIVTPRTIKVTSVTYPTAFALTLFANLTLMNEKAVAVRMEMARYLQHSNRIVRSIRMWLTEVISAVKVMIKVDVPIPIATHN